MNEKQLTLLLAHDFSAGTELFRDELLRRCLDCLETSVSCKELDEGELELLAAAGSVHDTFKKFSESQDG